MAVLAALLAPVLVGFVGLGVDTGLWYLRQADVQRAADAAALGAGQSLEAGASAAAVVAAAKVAAALNGFVDDGTHVSVQASAPDAQTVEVTITAEAPRFFSALFVKEPVLVSAQATAGLSGSQGSSLCILTLDPAVRNGIWIENMGRMEGDACDVVSNSTTLNTSPWEDRASIWVRNGTLTGASIQSVGDAIASTNGTSIISPAAVRTAAVADPLADYAPPAPPGTCTHTNRQLNWAANEQVLNPGLYCGGLAIQNGARARLNAGVYFIRDGAFSIQGGATVTGADVTFVLLGTTSAQVARLNFANDGRITLTAPTTGDTAGILFFQDRSASATVTNAFAGNADFTFDGALYLPARRLSASNNVRIAGTAAGNLVIVANDIRVTGSARITARMAQPDTLPPQFRGNGRLVLRR